MVPPTNYNGHPAVRCVAREAQSGEVMNNLSEETQKMPQKRDSFIWEKVVPGVAADRLKAPHVLLDSTLTLLMVVWVLYRVVFLTGPP